VKNWITWGLSYILVCQYIAYHGPQPCSPIPSTQLFHSSQSQWVVNLMKTTRMEWLIGKATVQLSCPSTQLNFYIRYFFSKPLTTESEVNHTSWSLCTPSHILLLLATLRYPPDTPHLSVTKYIQKPWSFQLTNITFGFSPVLWSQPRTAHHHYIPHLGICQ